MDKEAKDKFFNELMEKAYDKIYMFVSRGCSDREFVEDVVQETFLEAYRKIDNLRSHPNEMGWLYNTAKNKRMKLGAKRSEFYLLSEDSEIMEELKSDRDDYGEIEIAETIKNSISEKDYEMFRDYYLNGYSSEEVADKYGVDKGGIRMRMSRMKKKLKDDIAVDWLIFMVCLWRFL